MTTARTQFVLLSFMLAGCSHPELTTTDTSDPVEIAAAIGPTTDCQLGCQDTDPYPDSVGIFINFSVTPDLCESEYTDTDYDGFGDFCEERIAQAFAPVLFYTSGDDVTGEPRYALEPLGNGKVVVLYMLSMYYDFGDGACVVAPPPLAGNPCSGHSGDSESIAIIVRYEPSFQHWVLDDAYFSHHSSYSLYSTSGSSPSRYPTGVPYYGQPGGIVVAYTSRHKHALYGSDSECDSGAVFNADDCNSNAYYFVNASWSRNIGSRNFQYLDCVYSANPVFQNGPQECYWSGTQFTGWQGYTPSSSGNIARLNDFGF